jgi:hypothetical protein
LQESSTVDGDVGAKILFDMVRLGTKKEINVNVPKKNSPTENSSSKIFGILASFKKKFREKTPSETIEDDLKPVIDWAANRAIEEETEGSGGTLINLEDSTLNHEHLARNLLTDTERKLARRDDLFTHAIVEAIEMDELSPSRHSMEGSSSYASSTAESDLGVHRKEADPCPGSNSSTSALDMSISSSSSISNGVECACKTKHGRRKKTQRAASPDTLSCEFNKIRDDASDFSADSCYSSLTAGGLHRLPR